MKHLMPLETRSDNDDPLAQATQAVEELRTGFTEFRTSTESSLASIEELRTQVTDLETV